jgi:ParB family chromosome partitioning protein
MGAIDLDPATTTMANAVVGAETFFTRQTDGLAQEWRGRVFTNPPYAADLVGLFAEKLAASYEDGHVSQACVLVNNATETRWFQRLLSVASAVCFPRGRVRFWHPEKKSASPLQGQAVVYLGPAVATFAAVFSGFGAVPRLPTREQREEDARRRSAIGALGCALATMASGDASGLRYGG